MKLSNQFTIAAPIEQTWKTLLDLERVALCLPGASVVPSDEEGVFRGRMKVKFGAVTTDYSGVATIRELDEDDHIAVFEVTGKEEKGQGTASASITNRLESDGDGTKVTVETDLNITGRPAQFGRGLMEDVATLMLGEFANRLADEIRNGGSTQSANGRATATAGPDSAGEPEPPPPAEALDIGAVAWKPVAKRAVPAGGALLVIALLLLIFRGTRKRGLSIQVNL